MGYFDSVDDEGYYILYISNGLWSERYIWCDICSGGWFGGLYLCNVLVIEMVICLGVVYMVSYGSILVVWCILGIYLVSMGNILMVLMGIIFYRGLMIITMLMVIPNGNAHYYYNSLIMTWAIVGGTGSMYLRVLTLIILVIILVF